VVDTNVRRVVARAVHGSADAGSPSAVRDHADVSELLPKDGSAHRFSAALMELGATVCTARAPCCGLCPLSVCAWRAAGYPSATTAPRLAQRYAGTDRQVRGRLLDVLRASTIPVERTQLDMAWLTDTAQRDRALDSLLVDGLVEQTADGRFALCGEGDDAGEAPDDDADEGRVRGGVGHKITSLRRSRATSTEGDDAGEAPDDDADEGRVRGGVGHKITSLRRSRATSTEGDDAGEERA
jgi:adenine-specific DNA glycosylase